MPIDKFVLEYKGSARNIDASKTEITIKDLKQDTDYTFNIRATNRGEWGPITSKEVTTEKYCKYFKYNCFHTFASSMPVSFTEKIHHSQEFSCQKFLHATSITNCKFVSSPCLVWNIFKTMKFQLCTNAYSCNTSSVQNRDQAVIHIYMTQWCNFW